MDENSFFTCDICVCGPDSIAVIVGKLPEPHETFRDGVFLTDNCFKNIPKELGYYRCSVYFKYHPGYSEGYPAPGESDWELIITEAQKLAGPES